MKKTLVLLLLISGICHAQTYDDYYRNGNMLCNKGRYREAIESYKLAIKKDSMNGTAYRGRAFAEDKLGYHVAAIDDYTWYMALSRDSVMGCIWRAEIEINLRKYKQALADCNIALRHRPGFKHAYGIRGDTKFGLKDYKGAVADYDTVLMADTVVLYEYYFHRAAVKYIMMNYAGGSDDKMLGEYFTKFPNESVDADSVSAVADAQHLLTKPKPAKVDTQRIVARAKPRMDNTLSIESAPKSVIIHANSVGAKLLREKVEMHQVKLQQRRFATQPSIKNKWLEGYQRDSIFTELKLSKAIAMESDKGPLYVARGLIALHQGRAADACTDFNRAKELGYANAEEVINEYCK